MTEFIEREQKTYKFDINHFHHKSCVYLIHIKKNIYKFGMSSDIVNRWNAHYRNFTNCGFNPELVKIWDCKSSVNMSNIELCIKRLAKHEKIRIKKFNQTEIIKTDNINHIINKITEYVNEKNYYDDLVIRTKKNEAKIEKIKLQIELLNLQNINSLILLDPKLSIEYIELNNKNLKLQIKLLKLQKNDILTPKLITKIEKNNEIQNVESKNNNKSQTNEEENLNDIPLIINCRKETTQKWIKENLPEDGESTKDYREKYDNFMEKNKLKSLSDKDFPLLIIKSGYVKKRKDGIYKWFKE